MDGKDSESLGDEGCAAKVTPLSEDIKKTDDQDAESLKDNECAAKDAPLSGDVQDASEDDSKVKEKTRISSSSLLSNSFLYFRNVKKRIRRKLKHRETKGVPS